jgi:hypothetical protein
LAATPTTATTLATFLNTKGYTCTALDIAPTVGGTVGPFVLGKDAGNRQFGVAWGTVALPIVKATVDALVNGGYNMVLANFTATEIVLEEANAASVYPPVVTTPGVAVCTDDIGLQTDLLAMLASVLPPSVG